RRVLGLERDELGEGGERAVVVAEALVAQDADPPEQLAPLPLVCRAFAPDLEHADELADLVAHLVHMLEDARRAEPELADLEEPLDELLPLRVVLADPEDVLEVTEGVRGHVEPIEVDAPEPQLDVDDLLPP